MYEIMFFDMQKYIKFIQYTPANIRLDEDVLETSFVFVFGRRL